MAQLLQRVNQKVNEPSQPQQVFIERPKQLPDQVLADLQLTQVARQHNYTGTAAPTTEDNAARGYTPGSRWYVPGVTPEIYECVEASNGTATWVQVY
jgi:hypothetical protein